MIPGTSRSGSTIVGGLLFGADKRAAAEFSFYLAMPTMAGAFAFDLYKNRDILSAADLPVIATGFMAAFVMAVIVVRSLLDYVSRHGLRAVRLVAYRGRRTGTGSSPDLGLSLGASLKIRHARLQWQFLRLSSLIYRHVHFAPVLKVTIFATP